MKTLHVMPEIVARLKATGVLDAVRPAILSVGEDGRIVVDRDHPAWRGRPRPSPVPKGIRPVPRDQWPIVVSGAAGMFGRAEDRGFGDTFARLTPTLARIAVAALHALGWDCGCGRRRDEWNQRFPYRTED